jgi:hypothetical protein
VKLLDVVFPDGLFKGIPLGQGRGVDGSNPVASECTGAGHPMKAIPRVKVGANQVAQQVHFHPSGVEKITLKIIIDRTHSSPLPSVWRDSFRLLSIICHAVSGFPDILLSGDRVFFCE